MLLLVLAVAGAVWAARVHDGRVAGASELFVPTTFWQYQCLDTMKFSRDTAGQELDDIEKARPFVAQEMSIIKSLGANCVALGTPYDERFIPVLKLWVDEARKQNLAVWFRGNFSGWEGWFSYPKLASAEKHHELLYSFIINHTNLFKPWDILTPAPEAENGLLGNPWRSPAAADQLKAFVVESAETCARAQKDAGLNFRCGYFSANGDVAERIYDAQTAQATGGVIVMDHYVSSAERMENDITRVARSHNAAIMLGEFGAPIPDINGLMTEEQQTDFISSLLEVFRRHRADIQGINYWVLRGGSTSLINESDGSLREASTMLSDYYQPARLIGQVRDSRGKPVSGATVTIEPAGEHLVTNEAGQFGLPILAGPATITITHPDYQSVTTTVLLERSQTQNLELALTPIQKSLGYRVEEIIQNIRH